MMYRLNAVLDKEIDKLILKLTCKTKGPRLAKRLLKERKKKKKGNNNEGTSHERGSKLGLLLNFNFSPLGLGYVTQTSPL